MIRSTRASWWNYEAAGWYFITICTQHRKPFFGRITERRMLLNEIGNIAAAEWENSFALRPDMNLAMGEYIVMPDHFHAIIGIGPNRYNSGTTSPLISGGTTRYMDLIHNPRPPAPISSARNLKTWHPLSAASRYP